MDLMKLKLTDLRTNQEFLLLVTKINPKGLLVQAATTLSPGTPVKMQLTMEAGSLPLQMKGEIHKIAERPNGQKGMVIRFVSPPEEVSRAIAKHIDKHNQVRVEEHSEAESQIYESAPTGSDRTMMVAEDTLSVLTFSPPKKSSKKKKEIRPTLDEEADRQRFPDYADETRLVAVSELDSFVRKSKRRGWRLWVWPVLIVSATVGGLWFVGNFSLVKRQEASPFAEPPEEEVTELPEGEPTAEEAAPTPPEVLQQLAQQEPVIAPPEAPTEAPTPKPVIVLSELKTIAVEETAGFLKVTLEGPGVEKAEATRMMSPRRLVLQLRKVRTFSVNPTLPVGKNPLLRIRTSSLPNNEVQVVFDLYPTDFPRYDIKTKDDSVSVYLYR
jgi:hypothetical protein